MGIIAILIIICISVFIETLIYKKLALKNIEYNIYLSKHEVNEGDDIEIIEEISNNKMLPVSWLKTEISTSRWLEFYGTDANEASKRRIVPSVFFLAPYSKCTRKWSVKCVKRGIFHLNDVTISASDLLGFNACTKILPVSEKLAVLPVASTDEEFNVDPEILMGELTVNRFFCEDPFTMRGVHEYSEKEQINRIHWKSAAKMNKLMVRANEATTDSTVLVAINMRKDGDGLIRPIIEDDLEIFIKNAVSIFEQCEKNDIKSGFFCNGGIENDIVYVEASSKRSHFLNLMYELAGLDIFIKDEINSYLIHNLFQQYTDIILITSYINDELLKMAEELKLSGINIIFYCNNLQNIPYQLHKISHHACFYRQKDGE